MLEFSTVKAYKNILLAGVVAVVLTLFYIYVGELKSQINSLNTILLKNQVMLANTKLEATRCKAAISVQNKEIESLEVQKKEAEVKLKKWKMQPPKIKYRTIFKIREVKSNDCKDIKNVLNGIRTISFDSL